MVLALETVEIIHNHEEKQYDSATIDDADDDIPFDVLDFPGLAQHPPAEVLKVLLEVLACQYIIDISGEPTDTTIGVVETLPEKDVASCIQWSHAHGNRLALTSSLEQLACEGNQLRLSHGYNSYMTQIIANPLAWIDEDSGEDIRQLASKRLLENCGRTALPDITRIVKLSKNTLFKLFEPALTSDNLGLKTWGALLVLAKRLLLYDIKGEVLELGAGTGLVGMVCANRGYPTVLTDLPEICSNLQHNISLNELGKATVHPLDWTDHRCFIDKFGPVQYDTIVVSDPIYSSKHPQWVVATIDKFLKQGGTLLIEVPIRPNFDLERAELWQLLAEMLGDPTEEVEEHDVDTDWGELKYAFKRYYRF